MPSKESTELNFMTGFASGLLASSITVPVGAVALSVFKGEVTQAEGIFMLITAIVLLLFTIITYSLALDMTERLKAGLGNNG